MGYYRLAIVPLDMALFTMKLARPLFGKLSKSMPTKMIENPNFGKIENGFSKLSDILENTMRKYRCVALKKESEHLEKVLATCISRLDSCHSEFAATVSQPKI